MVATRLILLGAPGAGKGTQSARLIDELEIPQVSTGDLLRAARAEGNELGEQARAFMDAGKLVPDELVLSLVEERLSRSDAQPGFILDGFPRNVAQAQALAERGVAIDRVVSLTVRPEFLIERLSGRRVCRTCGASFHISFAPTRQNGVCDRCGGETYQRTDDTDDVIRQRLEVYEAQTAPLHQWYAAAGLLRVVDGEGEMDRVYEAVLSALRE